MSQHNFCVLKIMYCIYLQDSIIENFVVATCRTAQKILTIKFVAATHPCSERSGRDLSLDCAYKAICCSYMLLYIVAIQEQQSHFGCDKVQCQ